MIIRHGTLNDLDALSEIEAASYPKEQGASRTSIEQRLKSFPECFWILEENGKILAFINGLATDEKDLSDAMYDHAEMHDPHGVWQMLFSVVAAPDERHHGYASKVMEQVIADCRKEGRTGIVLTCLDPLAPFYSRFGYADEGLSKSVHGGVPWHQMRLTF